MVLVIILHRVTKDPLRNYSKGISKAEQAVCITLSGPLGANVLVRVGLALVLDRNGNYEVLQLSHFVPNLGLQNATPSVPGGHHHIAVKSEVETPWSVEVAEISGKVAFRNGLLLVAIAIGGRHEVVLVRGVLDPKHPTCAENAEENGENDKRSGMSSDQLAKTSEPSLQPIVDDSELQGERVRKAEIVVRKG